MDSFNNRMKTAEETQIKFDKQKRDLEGLNNEK